MIDLLILIHLITFTTITVNSTTPCFLNYTAGADILYNCGIENDFLTTALLPWQWTTGGNFSMVLVSVFVLMSYIKYQKVVYPIMIGTLFIPISWYLFPQQFLTWAIIMTGLAVSLLIGYIYISQTNES